MWLGSIDMDVKRTPKRNTNFQLFFQASFFFIYYSLLTSFHWLHSPQVLLAQASV